jgi:hypothetical protein
MLGAVLVMLALLSGRQLAPASPTPYYQLIQLHETGVVGEKPVVLRFNGRTGKVEKWCSAPIAVSEAVRQANPNFPDLMAEGWQEMSGSFYESMTAMSKIANGEK